MKIYSITYHSCIETSVGEHVLRKYKNAYTISAVNFVHLTAFTSFPTQLTTPFLFFIDELFIISAHCVKVKVNLVVARSVSGMTCADVKSF
jgi:hypothetical protein